VRRKATRKLLEGTGTGTLSGVSYFEAPTFVLTCKLKYKRVNTSPGKFSACETM
jgi:hypothetical protein